MPKSSSASSACAETFRETEKEEGAANAEDADEEAAAGEAVEVDEEEVVADDDRDD